jgi:hypothetical protein
MKTFYALIIVGCLINLLFSINDQNINGALGWFAATCLASLHLIAVPYLFDKKISYKL